MMPNTQETFTVASPTACYPTSLVVSKSDFSIFISYSRESDAHVDWVRRLADALEAMPEFHVVFDEYELHAGRDLTEFMDRGLSCDRIIAVVTPEYVRRAETRLGGVGYESSVISADLLANHLTDRCVPILKSGNDRPAFLRSKLYVDFRPPIQFEHALAALRRAVLRIAAVQRPQKYSSDENKNYTFDRFVPTGTSDAAFWACVGVGNYPKTTYNPLFLYGPAGSGKTHLLYAIAAQIRSRYPAMNVVHMTAEAFVGRLVQALRHDQLSTFRSLLATADALLLDDVDFIAGRERTQEELFHHLSNMLLHDIQIVLTASRPPARIPMLEERIRAQFEGGLALELGYPDRSALIQIARRAALDAGFVLRDDALNALAERSTRGAREIQSVVARIAAERELTARKGKAVDILDVIQRSIPPRATVEINSSVKARVASYFDVSEADLVGSGTTRNVSLARHVSWYLLSRREGVSRAHIAQLFGRRESTISAAVKSVERLVREDAEFADTVSEIESELS